MTDSFQWIVEDGMFDMEKSFPVHDLIYHIEWVWVWQSCAQLKVNIHSNQTLVRSSSLTQTFHQMQIP